MGRNLVLGGAVGYEVEQVIPFITSLHKTGYSGSVVLFADPALKRKLRRHPAAAGVRLVRAHQWLPFKLRLLERKRTTRLLWFPIRGTLRALLGVLHHLPLNEKVRLRLVLPVAQLLHTPMEARFLRYYRFVTKHPHSRVLLSDVRDVLFQNDPFAHLPDKGLAVSLETSSYTLATENHNATWMQRVYGPRVLSQIGHNRVSCVGMTYGDRHSILFYLKQMTDEILSLTPRTADVGGADTAIHNMLLWTNRLGRVHWLEPLASAVATLNGIDGDEIRLGPESKLLNVDGSEASVLHQYDRVPGLSPKLLRTLVG